MESSKRNDVLAAVERLVLNGGAEAVSMRSVAKEAGVSLRLVQYYGSTKSELLEGALTRLSERSMEQWRARLEATPDTPRDILSEFLRTALPVDEESRQFHRFGVSLEMLAVTDPDGAGRSYAAHLGKVADTLAAALLRHLDERSVDHIVDETIAYSHGMGSLVMIGPISPGRAERLIDGFLDRILSHR